MSKKILQFCFKQNSKILKLITTKAVFYVNILPILATAIPLIMIVLAIIVSISASLISDDKESGKPPNGKGNEVAKERKQPELQFGKDTELEKKQQTPASINEDNKDNTPVPINADNNNKTPENNANNKQEDIYGKQQKNIEQKASTSLVSKKKNLKPTQL